jgi:hypothetical protein
MITAAGKAFDPPCCFPGRGFAVFPVTRSVALHPLVLQMQMLLNQRKYLLPCLELFFSPDPSLVLDFLP